MSHIVILGAGYAGVAAARELAHLGPDHSATLVDRLPLHQLITQLPAVAAGRLPASKAAIPLTRIVPGRIGLVQAEVLSIAPSRGEVVTSVGTLTADRLIVCIGSAASDLGVPGALQWAIPLKSIRDATRIVSTLARSRHESRPLRVVVIGGGYTGTEFAGEITDRAYTGRAGRHVHVTIAQPDPRLLPQGNPRLAAAVARILRRRGVDMLFDVRLAGVERDAVILESGSRLPSDLTVWAARTRPPEGIRDVFDLSADGRIPVDPYLRSEQFRHVFVAGDLAGAVDLGDGSPFPASAQVAVPQGTRAGSNVARDVEGKRLEEFRTRLLGEALAFGRHDGAADVAGVITTGRIATSLKRAALLRYLNGLGSSTLVRDYI